MNETKQIVGIDVSKDTLNACYATYKNNQRIFKHKHVLNTEKGYQILLEWAEETKIYQSLEIVFLMEATGVYHENLLYYLTDNQKKASVVLPKKTKHFALTGDIKSKTDKIDAKMIAEFGLVKELKIWQKPSEGLREIRSLCRAYKEIKQKLTVVKNQLHALEYSHNSSKMVKSVLDQEMKLHKKNIKLFEKKLKEIVKSDTELEEKINNISTVKGLGFMSIVIVISETDGFALIENGKQLASYSGLDVTHRESGLMIGKTRISKKGNTRIRSQLYMPSLTAARYNKDLKEFYNRIKERRKIPQIANIAVERKLLLLIYTLWKKNEKYIENYENLKSLAA
jgi:transposase